MLPEAINKFSSLPIKITTFFFKYVQKAVPKFIWSYKKPSNSQRYLEKNKTKQNQQTKRNQRKDITLPNFKKHYKVVMSKIRKY